MTHLLSIPATSAFALLAFTVGRCRCLPDSLSDSYYLLGKQKWLFQALMMLCGLTLLPAWMMLSSSGCRCFVFLSCASLLFVATSPRFKKEFESVVHYSSALVCCASALAWMLCEGLGCEVFKCACVASVLTLFRKDRWCLFAELAVMVGVYRCLFSCV